QKRRCGTDYRIHFKGRQIKTASSAWREIALAAGGFNKDSLLVFHAVARISQVADFQPFTPSNTLRQEKIPSAKARPIVRGEIKRVFIGMQKWIFFIAG